MPEDTFSRWERVTTSQVLLLNLTGTEMRCSFLSIFSKFITHMHHNFSELPIQFLPHCLLHLSAFYYWFKIILFYKYLSYALAIFFLVFHFPWFGICFLVFRSFKHICHSNYWGFSVIDFCSLITNQTITDNKVNIY